LSVVIPTWNAADLVLEAIGHLQQPGPSDEEELIVVDDGSTDDTVGRVRRQFPAVVVLEQGANRGFGAAVNAGFREARGNYLGTVNNDVAVSWSTMRELVSFLEAHPEAAAAAPRIRDRTGQRQRVVFDFPRPPWDLVARRFDRRRTKAQTLKSADPVRSEYLRGACVVFRRAALEEVGLFDEQFFMFAEELDLFRRLDDAGWASWVVPRVVAEHSGGQSSRAHRDRAVSSRFRRLSYRSMCRYYHKHHVWPVAMAMRAVLAARVSGRLAGAVLDSARGRADAWWIGEHARCMTTLMQPAISRPVEPRLFPTHDTR
jgi:GT2 family glycosyltransferase